MALKEDEAPEQLELSSGTAEAAAKLDARRARLLQAVNSCQLNTMEERVAWVLNHYPKTRDSDLTLQIRFWQHFQGDRFEGGSISVSDYYHLAKLTSLARARALIQNRLKLFQASEDVKKHRKQLEEGERSNALKQRPNCHRITVYVDESGKTQDHLIVGSMWYLNGAETIKIYRAVENWKKMHGLDEELHFKSITEAKLPHYMELADLISAQSATVSFKVVSVPRRGIGNIQDALLRLTSHLLIRGIEHEHASGRAPLPRGLSVCKDAEEVGQDKIFAAELSDKIKQAAIAQFHGDLHVDECSAEQSATNTHLQITDLFASSVGRKLNALGERKHPKDQFADYFLVKLGRTDMANSEEIGDMTAHIAL